MEHPIVQKLRHRYAQMRFTFGVYSRNEEKVYSRRVTTVCADEVEYTTEVLKASMSPTEELTLHSEVFVGGYARHIPMIDFESRSLEQCYQSVSRHFGSDYASELLFFDSGRSFHAYEANLLSPKEWRAYMGQLLLINEKDQPPVVDTRWVGHRLVDGFGALRWTCNSGRYLEVPRVVGGEE